MWFVHDSTAVSRYWTSFLRQSVAELSDLEEKKADMLKDAMRQLFAQFADHYDMWMQAITCFEELDCLSSLAVYSGHAEGTAFVCMHVRESIYVFAV